jgi:hypothetical protein
MITWGFVCGYSDLAVTDSLLTMTINNNLTTFNASYIQVTGTTGDIVWENNLGIPQYIPNAQPYQLFPVGARRILSSATVNGNVRTTAATNIAWFASAPMGNSQNINNILA